MFPPFSGSWHCRTQLKKLRSWNIAKTKILVSKVWNIILTPPILLLASSQLSWKTVVFMSWRSPTVVEKFALRNSGFLYLVSFWHCSLCPSDFCRTCISRTLWPESLLPDRVENPDLQGEWKTQADGMCQLSLYCSVSKDDNVSFALYRGSKLISTLRNFTYLENQTDASSLHTYTCNVSNKVSWASNTQNFTQGCQSVPLSKWGHFGSLQGFHIQTHKRPGYQVTWPSDQVPWFLP